MPRASGSGPEILTRPHAPRDLPCRTHQWIARGDRLSRKDATYSYYSPSTY